jgi:hypothetical protein
MSARLLASLILLSCAADIAAQSSPPRKPEVATKRSRLFIGRDSSGAAWLPKTSMLPDEQGMETAAQKLGARVRNLDPFGVPTFPRENAMPLYEEETLRATPRITLNQALQTLRLNGVNLGRKEFLIGGRNVFEGDVIEMVFKGEIFQALVVEVGHAELRFRDLIRDETGVLPHQLVPRLALEPMRRAPSGLDGKALPMEPATPQSP